MNNSEINLFNNNFEKPHPPIGYVAFDFETKTYRGKFAKLELLRKFFHEHNIPPEDVVVFRVFDPDLEDSDRRLMQINEYAFSHIDYECYSTGDCIEHQSWKWSPKKMQVGHVDMGLNFITNLKNLLMLSTYKLTELLRKLI